MGGVNRRPLRVLAQYFTKEDRSMLFNFASCMFNAHRNLS